MSVLKTILCIIGIIIVCFALGCSPAHAQTYDDVWAAICQVESGGNPDAHNPGEDARGIAQIRAIMVRDVNRIVGEQRYTHDDAYDPVKAREMFDIYNAHYHPNASPERIARCWNGGPRGHLRDSTLGYWRRVQSEL